MLHIDKRAVRVLRASHRWQFRSVSLDAFTENKKFIKPTSDAETARKFLNRWKLVCEPSKRIFGDQLRMMNSEFAKFDEDIKGPKTYLAFLICCGNQGHYRTCWRLINEMKAKGLPVTETELTPLLFGTINGCNIFNEGGFLEAREKESLPLKMKLGRSFYAHAFSLYSKRHRLFVKNGMHKNLDTDTALNLFKVMVEFDNVTPNERMWGVLLSTRSSYASAMLVFDKITQAGIPPNIKTYNLLLRVCASSRNTRDAERIIKMMKDENILIDSRAYGTLLTAYKSEGSQESLRKSLVVFKHLKEEKMLDEAIVSIIIGICCQTGTPFHYDIAMDAFDTAIKQKMVDTSLLHAATSFAKKMNDLERLKSIHNFCEANNRKSTVTSILKVKTGSWKRWAGHEPYGVKKREMINQKTRNLSVSVDLLEPNKSESVSNKRRILRTREGMPKGAVTPTAVTPQTQNVAVNDIDDSIKATPRPPSTRPARETPPSPQREKAGTRPAPSSSNNRPPLPSWL